MLVEGIGRRPLYGGQERKLFVAHILYGHRYEMWGRGRIEKPLALVRALINRGTRAL